MCRETLAKMDLIQSISSQKATAVINQFIQELFTEFWKTVMCEKSISTC